MFADSLPASLIDTADRHCRMPLARLSSICTTDTRESRVAFAMLTPTANTVGAQLCRCTIKDEAIKDETMRFSPTLSCLWPGLPALWYRGDLLACVVAILFAMSLNFLLIASWHWPLWFSPMLIRSLWFVAGFVWLAGCVHSMIYWNSITSKVYFDADKDVFPDAQVEYLKGNWFEAEGILHQVLARNSRDVEAALLMVSVLRHTHRYTQAIAWIERLRLLESASRWRQELDSESRKIQVGIEAKAAQAKADAEAAEQAVLDKQAADVEALADALYS